MKSTSPDINPIIIDDEVFRSLDEFHQALAIVLQRRGRAIIVKAEAK